MQQAGPFDNAPLIDPIGRSWSQSTSDLSIGLSPVHPVHAFSFHAHPRTTLSLSTWTLRSGSYLVCRLAVSTTLHLPSWDGFHANTIILERENTDLNRIGPNYRLTMDFFLIEWVFPSGFKYVYKYPALSNQNHYLIHKCEPRLTLF